MNFETAAIHSGERPDKCYGALSVPIYQTSNFVFEDIGKTRGYDYTRSGNPTRKVLEDTIARLEGGHAAFACATGMAAIATALHLLKVGDHVISCDDIYGGTYRLFQSVMSRFGIEITFACLRSRAELEAAIQPNTRMIWLETPSNPLLNITDLEMVATVAKERQIMTVLDNTFASPFFLQPVSFGIDLVVHSTTKYLNGHCDVVGGAIVTTTPELSREVGFLVNTMGVAEAPFDAWLVLRGIETLPLRMARHEENSFAVARFLKEQPGIRKVYYPGLADHPGHDIARRQMTGFGGVVSFEMEGGFDAACRVLRKLHLFALAESLGGPSSLAEHPVTMSHASMSAEHRQRVGINDGLIRLSVGLEHIDDLIADLMQALSTED
ncbi:cystathionine gamma-synthase [Dehalogenimonas alkenigignens]|uniref:Cystathionine gamma-synthase n=1 Tax=Dehalogenimonas alkenigignens TaxID=1217799 RepID=A0A0W0GL51_9CHLR|nr:PLP-dependent aspartate aminotransferase family protein [Dehalogenimonas alkenigignens]KTB49292.1 cystathionine gamma-synthase [Dehalogenimonas alkenigignens]